MPYTNTYRLILKYADKFINNTLSYEDIKSLNASDGSEFPSVPGEHNSTEAIQDFIQTIGPLIPADKLHEITHKFLKMGAKFNEGENTFMRNSTMEKNLLAFEMIHYPAQGQQHIKENPVKDKFKSPEEIKKLENVILGQPKKNFNEQKNKPVIPLQQLLDVAKYNVQITDLLEKLKVTKESLIKKAETNDKYAKVATTITELYDTLKQGMKGFFNDPSATRFKEYHSKCDEAIKNAVNESAQHRGWYKVDPVIRGIVGVLAAIAIIPAITVAIAMKDKGGYAKTFFVNEKEKPETSTARNTNNFKQEFEKIKEEFVAQENPLSKSIRKDGFGA